MALRVDLRVPSCRPIPGVVDFVRQCEDAGLNGVGLLDSQLLVRDIFVTMGMVAHQTRRIKIMTCVTNPVTRHPAILASAIASIAEMAPGRVELILGSGYSAVRTIGLTPATVAQMRDAVLAIRRLLQGETVKFNGVSSHLAFPPQHPIPIYVAAVNPRVIELAAEVADGVLLQVGMSPGILATARRHIEEGARRADRAPADVKVAVCLRVAVAKDVRAALEESRSVCANWVLEKHRSRWLKAAGIPIPEFAEFPPEVRAIYPDLSHPEDPVAARKATAFLSEEMLRAICDALGVVGPEKHLFQRLKEAEEWGVSHVYLMTPATYELPREVLAAFKHNPSRGVGRDHAPSGETSS
ncbi:MAG: LLM class flavin-dependent oxidoreductase [Chloroflexi bacterium]|nr:LLM class flavin-dependent oxidoreductase [Chloroflexota bacterium]